MSSFREFNRKVRSLRGTQRVTQTMKLVASTKLRRAQEAQKKASAYAAKLNKLVARLARAAEASAHPLLAPRPNPRNALLILITSDRGLCGGFNNNIIKAARHWLADNARKYRRIRVSFFGRRGWAALKDDVEMRSYYEDLAAKPKFVDAVAIGHELCNAYLARKYDEIFLAYNVFNSPISQDPKIIRLLPTCATDAKADREMANTTYLIEPAGNQMIGLLLTKTVIFNLFYALLQNAAGENGARMTAMDNATSNIDKLCEHFSLLRNRIRQAGITTELTEIVSGAEALK